MKLKYYIIALAILLGGESKAQTKALWVGDSVPQIKIPNIYNGSRHTASIADFRDRLLILDFGNTHCPGCIEALPHMESLEKRFGDKVRIFWVTYEPEAVVSKFWKHNPLTKNNAIQTICGDSTLAALFPHKSWPHEVWIYKGKVVAITDPDHVDAASIRQILNGDQVNWPVKNDFYVFDGNKTPLFIPDTNQIDMENTPLRYAAICDYREGVNSAGLTGGSGIARDPIKKTIRAFFLNQPIYSSYDFLYAKLKPHLVKPSKYLIGPNEVVWEVGDHRSRYQYNKEKGYRLDWLREHAICYESLNPDTGQTDSAVEANTIRDINRLLGLNVRWERRKEKVLVLVRTARQDKQFDTTWKKRLEKRVPETTVDAEQIVNTFPKEFAVEDVAYRLNQQEGNPYVFDETGYDGDGLIDANIEDWTHIDEIKSAIAPYGLALKEEEREVDKLVFSEVNVSMVVNGKRISEETAKERAQDGMNNPTAAENDQFMEANKSKPGVIVLPSGLQYKVIKQGTGPKPGAKDKVKVDYTGTLVNGKIFDSSFRNSDPVIFNVSDVIAGWKEALQLMPVGSKWMIYVPAALAYGTHTGQGHFPPNSNMIFEIELKEIVK